ncbi:MAG: hypothetical protein CMB64_04665 [Euryarchaeota archaeon]|nr:hypothetical protein [Euryarchaeota archaeon]|tara:strand:- start:3042 stop:3404 length:363 start_codon:yes stop_codon:yes gene_type:complete
MDLAGLPIRSTADTYLQDLQRFLPKYVSKIPALKKTLIVMFVYVIFFHFFISNYVGLDVDFRDKDKKDLDRLIYFCILVVSVVGLAAFFFNLFYLNDNIAKNGNWITMKKLGMTFFHGDR